MNLKSQNKKVIGIDKNIHQLLKNYCKENKVKVKSLTEILIIKFLNSQ